MMPKVERIRCDDRLVAWNCALGFIEANGIERMRRIDISSEGTDTLISIYYTED